MTPVRIGQAQTSEVIQDPELAGPEGPGHPDAGESGGTELIADPELAGLETAAAAPTGLGTEIRGVVHSRLARDIERVNPAEEVWEVQHLFQLEAKLRPDPDTRISLGGRLRYAMYATERADDLAGALRYLLDVQPVATYYDRTVAAGVHLRLGYQDVHLGRFDAVSGTDVLSVADLRDGPNVMPDAARVSQLAARVDLIPSATFGIEFYCVPFFTPHLWQVTEGDFAGLSADYATTDALLAATFDGEDNALDTTPEEAALARAAFEKTVREGFGRTARAQWTQSGAALFAPEPDFATAQLGLRGVLHGSAGELGFTLATALEKVPGYELSEPALAALRSDPDGIGGLGLGRVYREVLARGNDAAGLANKVIGFEALPFKLFYGRFFVGALDAAFDAGPVQLGMEASVAMNRVLPVAGPLYDGGGLVEFERATIGRAGVRAEYIGGREWLFVIELDGGAALTNPRGRLAQGYIGLQRGRYLFSAATLLAFAPSPFRFEVGAAWLVDTTYYVMPRFGLDMGRGIELELGVQLLGAVSSVTPNGIGPSWGAFYDSTDQVFVGLRWVPAL